MTIDHFGDLSLVRIFGFFTAAEGFVFISGIVAGIVYYSKGQKLTANQLNHSAKTRSLKIYKYHLICLVCLCIVIALDFGFLREFYSTRANFFVDNTFYAAFLNALFIYKIYHLDILPMYVIFVLAIPLALRIEDRFGIVFFLAFSGALWFLNLFGTTEILTKKLLYFVPTRLGQFQVASWQFLFFLGFAFGIAERKGNFTLTFKEYKYFIISVVLLLIFFSIKWLSIIELLPENISTILVSRDVLGLARIINFLTLCYFVGFILNKIPKVAKVDFFQLLGRNSLYVFTFQTMFLFVIIPFYHEWYVHGYLRNMLDSKILWKIATVFSTLPLALVIILPAMYKEQRQLKVAGR
jgi:hypothetical protein